MATPRKVVLKQPIQPHRYQPYYEGDDTWCKIPGCNAVADAPIHNVGGKNNMAQDRIVIERVIRIAEVVEGNGPESMIATAFLEAGRYFADNDDSQGIEITFDFADRTFRLALEPDQGWKDAHNG